MDNKSTSILVDATLLEQLKNTVQANEKRIRDLEERLNELEAEFSMFATCGKTE